MNKKITPRIMNSILEKYHYKKLAKSIAWEISGVAEDIKIMKG